MYSSLELAQLLKLYYLHGVSNLLGITAPETSHRVNSLEIDLKDSNDQLSNLLLTGDLLEDTEILLKPKLFNLFQGQKLAMAILCLLTLMDLLSCNCDNAIKQRCVGFFELCLRLFAVHLFVSVVLDSLYLMQNCSYQFK